MSLEWLISPTSFAAFRDQYWSRTSLRVAGRGPSYYSSLFSEADLEENLLAASRAARAIEELTEDDNARPTRGHGGAVAVFRAGKSLRVTAIQRFSLKLAKLSRDLEQTISAPININLYLSPPSGKKALLRHFDMHDVFVMQLFGRKSWKLFGPPEELPLEFLPLMHRETIRDMKQFRLKTKMEGRNACRLTDEFVLGPGDLLYLPRGFWHEAETEPGSVSCHLTVGVQPTTYSDLIALAVAQLSLSQPRLRRSLPLGFATNINAKDEVASTVSEIMQSIQGKVDASAALSQCSDLFHRTHWDALENNLLKPAQGSEVDSIALDSWVHVRKGIVVGVDENLSPAQLVFGTNKFQIDALFVEACRFICSRQRFTPAALPGTLTDEQKLSLVKQLIAESVLLPSVEEKQGSPVGAAQENLSGCVPARVSLKSARVHWVQLDEGGLRDPFFDQTVRRACHENPLGIRRTGLETLLAIKEDLQPAGFIFHVSRCGSTLLANGLRTCPGSIVVSEPQPISALLVAPEEWRGDGGRTLQAARLLQGVMRAYGQRRNSREHSLVVKFTSWNLLYVDQIRKLWPQVPCVIVVRHPLEVAVSCLAEPPGWMHSKVLLADAEPTYTPEARCAQTLGAFFRAAATQSDELCRIVDYEDLDVPTIQTIGHFFKMSMSSEVGEQALMAALSVYSKDPAGSRPFRPDSKQKCASASDLLRREVDQTAVPLYFEARRGSLITK